MPPRDSWNGDLEGYLLRHINLHNNNSGWQNVTIGSYVILVQEVRDLIFQQRYMFQMQTFSLLGASNWSVPTFVFMEVGRNPKDDILC